MTLSIKAPKPKSPSDFIEAAETPRLVSTAPHVVPTQTPTVVPSPEPTQESEPWTKFERNEKQTETFNMRFNSYEKALLKALAERSDGRSMHWIAKKLLVKAMETELGIS